MSSTSGSSSSTSSSSTGNSCPDCDFSGTVAGLAYHLKHNVCKKQKRRCPDCDYAGTNLTYHIENKMCKKEKHHRSSSPLPERCPNCDEKNTNMGYHLKHMPCLKTSPSRRSKYPERCPNCHEKITNMAYHMKHMPCMKRLKSLGLSEKQKEFAPNMVDDVFDAESIERLFQQFPKMPETTATIKDVAFAVRQATDMMLISGGKIPSFTAFVNVMRDFEPHMMLSRMVKARDMNSTEIADTHIVQTMLTEAQVKSDELLTDNFGYLFETNGFETDDEILNEIIRPDVFEMLTAVAESPEIRSYFCAMDIVDIRGMKDFIASSLGGLGFDCSVDYLVTRMTLLRPVKPVDRDGHMLIVPLNNGKTERRTFQEYKRRFMNLVFDELEGIKYLGRHCTRLCEFIDRVAVCVEIVLNVREYRISGGANDNALDKEFRKRLVALHKANPWPEVR